MSLSFFFVRSLRRSHAPVPRCESRGGVPSFPFVERVDRHEDRIVVLIFDLDHFLHGPIATRDAHESDKLPHSVIDMHHIVARLKLTNLFERERHLGIARVVGTQIVLVETIEDLVV